MNDIEKKAAKVLLVDDDKFLVDMYSMKFTQQGYAVQASLSADDALKALRDGFVPDVILFDLVMPEHDGFDFLQSLSKERLAPHAIKIALTNQGEDAERTKATELGSHRYIVKATMIPSEVVNIVREEIARKSKA